MPSVRVLMYHGVDRIDAGRDPHGMFVDPDTFRRQMEALLASGHRPISEDDYLAGLSGAPVPRKAVLVTFDDAYAGVGEHAAPVLEELAIPSVLYVPAELIGREARWLTDRHPLMTAAQLRAVAAGGMAIGAHGLDHTDLTTLDAHDLQRHTVAAREALGEVSGSPVRTFAYPYGSHDARVRAAVRDAGYAAAFAVHEPCGRFAVARVDVNALDTARTFGLKLRPWYSPVRRGLDRAPALRRRLHDAIGYARRDTCPPTAGRECR